MSGRRLCQGSNERFRYAESIFSIALLSITAVSGVLLASSSVFADDNTSAVDETQITVPASCSMSGTGQTSHTANINNGVYIPDIGTTTISVFCNDAEGFAIYAAGYTGDEVGGTNSNKLVGTTASDNAVIESGLATSTGNPDVSNWAMKLTMTQDSGDTIANAFTIDSAPNVALPSEADPSAAQALFSEYHVVPNEYVKVAHKNSMTDMTANTGGVKLTSTYAAYISKTQVADTYSGKVIYTLVHPASAAAPEVPYIPKPVQPTAGYISYNPNFKDLADSMGDQSVASNAASADLWASNFINPTGYGFAGWNTEPDYSGTSYGPNETISDATVISNIKSTGLSLYAIWVPSNGNSLQGWTGCSALTKANEATDILSQSITALTDQRDNQTYAVAKLADGNCWMIENLRLDNQYTTSAADIAKAQGYNSRFIGLADPETANFTSSTAANSLYSTDGSTTAPAITGNNKAYRFPRYNNQNTAALATNMTAWDNSANTYSVGNWYTWSAAIADTSNYTTSSQTIASTSICPTGWRLPIGAQSTASKSFGALSVALGGPEEGATADSSSSPTGTVMSGVFRSYPNNFLYSGLFTGSSPGNRSGTGHYRSSTSNSGSRSYGLSLDRSSVNPGTGTGLKYYGSSIRCLTQ